MTINSEVRVAGPFQGNGGAVDFPFTFKVFDADEVLVVREEAGVELVLELSVDYTVALNADQEAAPGGAVTLLAGPLPSGETLTLTSALAPLQPVDLTNQGGFYPRVINSALDRLTILVQQLSARLGRALKFPISDGPVGDLPVRGVRAGAVLAFDAATGEPIAGPNIAQLGTVAAGIAAIGTVADNITDVNTVADNIADVNTVAAGLGDVSNFAGVYYGPNATGPTTRRDGSPLQEGDLYFNTTGVGGLRVYNGTAWRDSVSGSVTVQNLSGDGVETEFQLNYAPESENVTSVFISGVYQQKNTYQLGGVVGDLLIFDAAPPLGSNNIEVVVSSLVPSDDRLRQELAEPEGAALVGVGGGVNLETFLANLGTASGADTQESLFDATPGRVQLVGAFGGPGATSRFFLAEGEGASTDFNSITSPGVHFETLPGVGANGPGGAGRYYVKVVKHNANNFTQIAYPMAGAGGVCFRECAAGVFSPWSFLLTAERTGVTHAVGVSGIQAGQTDMPVGAVWKKLMWQGINFDYFPPFGASTLNCAVQTAGVPNGNFVLQRTGVYRFKAQIYVAPPENVAANISLYLGLTDRGAIGTGSSVLRVANVHIPPGMHPSLTIDCLVQHTGTRYYSFDCYFLDGGGVTPSLALQSSGQYCWASVEGVR